MAGNLDTSRSESATDETASLAFLGQPASLTAPLEITRRDVGKAHYRLGKLHYDKSDLSAAEDNFLIALEGAERPRDGFSILKTLGFLIRIASEKMENDKAQDYIRQTEAILDELSRTMGGLNAEYFYNVGLLKTYQGGFQEAKDNFQFALKRSREENEPDLQAKCLLALAINAFNMRQYGQALELLGHLEQLLKIINKQNILKIICHCDVDNPTLLNARVVLFKISVIGCVC